MKDRVAANPNRYAVYDDDHNFLRYEYHERADNPTEVGTPLDKGTLLADETAAALGLTGDPTVNKALLRLATMPNCGLWEKYSLAYGVTVSSESVTSSDFSMNVYYTFYKTARTVDGSVVLSNPVSYKGSSVASGVFYVASGTPYKTGRLSSNDGSHCRYDIYAVSASSEEIKGDFAEYVTSPAMDAYPTSGISSGYFYIYKGVVGSAAQIINGSYVGTGSYNNSSNQNKIVFPVAPKVVVICDTQNSYGGFVWLYGIAFGSSQNQYNCNLTWADNVLEWYSATSAADQLNTAGHLYKWMAII